MRFLRLLLAAALGYAAVRWLRGGPRIEAIPLPPAIPIAEEDPFAGGPGEDTSWWPEFDRPRFIDWSALPSKPACGETYTLVYTDAFNWGGANAAEAARQAARRGPGLLAWARAQAKRYCLRNEACQATVEVGHTVSWAVYVLADEDVVEVTLTYRFRCADAGPVPALPPGTQPPPPTPLPSRPYFREPAEPTCGGEYTFVAHAMTRVAAGCRGADAATARADHAARLRDAARARAREFCRRIPNEYCRSTLEHGFHVTDHCVPTGKAGESFVLSTIVYRFGCAMLA